MKDGQPSFWASLLEVSIWVFGTLAVLFTLWALWDFARTLKTRHKAIRALFVLTFSLLIIGGAAFSVWAYGNAQYVQHELARIRAAGEPLTFAQLADPKAVELATADGAYVRAATDRTQQAMEAGMLYLAALDKMSKRSMAESAASEIPHGKGFWVDELTMAYSNWLTHRSMDTPSDAQVERARAIANDNDETFKLMARAAEEDIVEFPWGQPFLVNRLMQTLEDLIVFAELHLLCSYVELADRGPDAALDLLHGMRRLVRIFDSYPNAITSLTRMSLLSMLLLEARTFVESGRLSHDQLNRLMSEIQSLAKPGEFRRMLLAERVSALASMGYVEPYRARVGYTSLLTHTKNAMLASSLEHARRSIKVAELDWPQMIPAMQQIVPKGLYAETGPRWGPAAVLFARVEAERRAVILAIACELYRRDHGEPPETLQSLVPKYLSEIPADPFDGKPMRYKREADTLLIYSVHADHVDDGGDIDRPQNGDPKDWGIRLRLP